MSDKNFKVKNGIDAAGKLTITNTSGATSLIEVNGAGGGQFTVTPYGGISTNAGFQSIGGPSYFGGYGGTENVIVNVTGASGQTADLQRWTTFSGTVLAKVDSTGSISATDLTLSGNLTVNGTTTNLNSTNLIIEDKNIIIADVATPTDTTADGAGITIKGTTDKTFSWVQSTGSFTSSEPLIINTSSTSSTALVVKASPTYPAQLQEWKNASGTTLAQIGYNGNASFYNIVPFSNSGTYVSLGSGAIGFVSRATTTPTVTVYGTASQTADLQQWQDSAGTVLSSVSSNGKLYVYENTEGASGNALDINQGSGSRRMVFGSGGLNVGSTASVGSATWNALAQFEVYPAVAGRVGLVIKGADSQTANLQEWRQFNNVIGTRIGPFGELVGNNTLANGIGGTIGLVMWSVISGAANFVPIVAKGHSSQSANLQEWQDSSGTVLVSVLSNGRTTIRSNGADYGAALSVGTNSTTAVGLVIRGVASQTADLQQWQNSAGTTAYLNSALQYYNPGRISILDQNFSAILSVFSGNPAAIVSIFRGASSQSADLTRWQNSAGTVLASVTQDGDAKFRLVYVGTTTNYGAMFNVNTLSAANIGIIVQGVTSQTGDLQQWRNNIGTVLAKVDANGNFSAISKSFDIPHPTKENMRLRYASLEGSENGVYIRGTSESNIIELPDYWTGLVHEDSITVSLTSVGSAQNIYVEKIENNKVYIGGELRKAFFIVYGERKDIDKLTVEY